MSIEVVVQTLIPIYPMTGRMTPNPQWPPSSKTASRKRQSSQERGEALNRSKRVPPRTNAASQSVVIKASTFQIAQ